MSTVFKQAVSKWIGMVILIGSVLATQNLSTEVVNEHHGLVRRQYSSSLVNTWGPDAQIKNCSAMATKISTDSSYKYTLNTNNCAVINCKVAVSGSLGTNISLTYDPCSKRVVVSILGSTSNIYIPVTSSSGGDTLSVGSFSVLTTLSGFTTTMLTSNIGIISYSAKFSSSFEYVTGGYNVAAIFNTDAPCLTQNNSTSSAGSNSSMSTVVTAVIVIVVVVTGALIAAAARGMIPGCTMCIRRSAKRSNVGASADPMVMGSSVTVSSQIGAPNGVYPPKAAKAAKKPVMDV